MIGNEDPRPLAHDAGLEVSSRLIFLVHIMAAAKDENMEGVPNRVSLLMMMNATIDCSVIYRSSRSCSDA